MTSIALCTLKGGNYNHTWRFVSPITVAQSLWQCQDCHMVVQGRNLTPEEAKKETVIIQSIEAPQ